MLPSRLLQGPVPALLPEEHPQQPSKQQLDHQDQTWGLQQQSQLIQEPRLQGPLSPRAGTRQLGGPRQPGPAALGQQHMQVRDSAADHLFKLLPEWVRHALQARGSSSASQCPCQVPADGCAGGKSPICPLQLDHGTLSCEWLCPCLAYLCSAASGRRGCAGSDGMSWPVPCCPSPWAGQAPPAALS